MKVNKLFFVVLTVLLAVIVSSCYQEEYDIQIPEKVYGDMNLLEKKLSKDFNSSNNLSYEYKPKIYF